MSSSPKVSHSQDISNQNTTFTPRRRIRDEGHRNWIRCNLGLQEIGDAVRPHVDRIIHDYWDSYFRWNCGNRCDTSDCKPAYPHCHCGTHQYTPNYWHGHKHPQDWCCHFRRRNRFWYIDVKPRCNGCEKEFRDVLDCFIKPDSEKIYWRNVEFPLQGKGHWEIAKVFMPEGNTQTNKPEQAEPTALLTVMNSCKLFDDGDLDHNILDKVIKKRNTITHNAAHEVDDEETDKIFTLMIACLQNLKKFYPCQKELTNLEDLRKKEITGEIIEKTLAKHIQRLMNTISDLLSSGQDAQHLLKCLESATKMKIQHTVAADYEAEIEQLKDEIDDRKNRESALENTVKDKEQIIEIKDKKINELEMKIENLQEAREKEVRDLTERIDDLNKRIADVQKDLDSKNDEVTDLNVKIENLSQVNEEMKAQLLSKEETIKGLEETLSELHAENKEMIKMLDKQRAYIQRIQEDLNEMKNANQALKDTNDRQKSDIQSHINEKEELKRANTELEQKLEDVKQRLEKITTEKKDLEVKINDLEGDVALKEREMDILREDILQLNRLNDERQTELQNISTLLILTNIVTVVFIVFFFRIGMILY